jgi:hypothetical protein
MTGLEPAWQDTCCETISLLDQARSQSAAQVMERSAEAMRRLVEVRDGLIDRVRSGQDGALLALERINVTLSELASLAYPGQLDRQHIDTAQAVLRELLGS